MLLRRVWEDLREEKSQAEALCQLGGHWVDLSPLSAYSGKPAGWGGNRAKKVADLLGEHGLSDLARMCLPSGIRARGGWRYEGK